MFTRQIRAFLPVLALTALLAGLSGCGWQSDPSQVGAKQVPTNNILDSVQIVMSLLGPGPQGKQVTLTLKGVSQVRKLYTAIVGLPLLPQNTPCTADAGPSYALTFWQGGKVLTTATAQRFGCGVVTLSGEKQDRRANQAFWSQFDQAVYDATPIAQPQQLAILHTVQLDQLPQTAQITSAETARRLYDAILALPQAPQNENSSCAPALFYEYHLVFHTTDQAIASVFDNKCNTISLEGNYQSRTGTFIMNNQFKQLFQQTLATTTFAQAHPDRLTLNLQPSRGTVKQSTIADAGLRQQLFALSKGNAQPDCPSGEDKLAGKGTFYTFSFTQWDLPILASVDAYEGSCTLLSIDGNTGMGMGQILQGDGEFWNLAHQAANS
jgi:hypothetical protein